MIDVDYFTDDQKKLLSFIISDFGGPTSSPTLLYIIENLLNTLKPDWQLDNFRENPELKSDIEVCMAALNYLKIQNIAEER